MFQFYYMPSDIKPHTKAELACNFIIIIFIHWKPLTVLLSLCGLIVWVTFEQESLFGWDYAGKHVVTKDFLKIYLHNCFTI